jgi:flavin-dependent dehydrogenase
MKEKFGGPFWDTHRADLQMALYEKAQELGVEFQFGAKVTAYDFSKPTATLATGETLEGDLIVAADGKYLSKPQNISNFINSGPLMSPRPLVPRPGDFP